MGERQLAARKFNVFDLFSGCCRMGRSTSRQLIDKAEPMTTAKGTTTTFFGFRILLFRARYADPPVIDPFVFRRELLVRLVQQRDDTTRTRWVPG